MQVLKEEKLNAYGYPVGYYITRWRKYSEEYCIIIRDENIRKNYVSLYCTGSSGSIIAALISTKISVSCIHYVKKPSELNHECNISMDTNTFNVIVDDFTCTGESIERILNEYPGISFDLCIVGMEAPAEVLNKIADTGRVKKFYCGTY